MNIIKLAKEAGFDLSVDEYNGNLEVDCEGVYYTEVLERFAALVRAEREWVDLTCEEVTALIREGAADGGWQGFATRVQTAFKEKNNV